MVVGKIHDRNSNSVAYKNLTNNNKMNQEERNKAKEKSNTIYAGELNFPKNNILEKKIQAQKKAMKTLMDAYSIDKGLDDKILERRQHIKELEETAVKAQEECQKIDGLREDLKKEYNISDDSLEQKQLEVMEKVVNHKPLNEEENKIFADMGELTDYQKNSLEYYKMKEEWQKRLKKANNEKIGENFTINSIHLGRLKNKFMVDASNKAEDVLETASKEAINMYLDEVKENIDEKIEDSKEKEEELKEKEEEKEEQVNNNSDNIATQEAVDFKVVGDMNDTVKQQSEIEQEIKSIAKKLLAEDIKGVAVDKKV